MAGFLMRRPPREAATTRSSRDMVSRLQDEMDEMISRFFGDGRGLEMELPILADVSENDQEIEVRLDAPGINPEQISVEVQNDLLTISGSRSEEKEEKGRTYHRVERQMGAFARTISLPCSVREDAAQAEYHDGVLTIRLPKAEEAKRRKIEIKH